MATLSQFRASLDGRKDLSPNERADVVLVLRQRPFEDQRCRLEPDAVARFLVVNDRPQQRHRGVGRFTKKLMRQPQYRARRRATVQANHP